MARKHLFQGLFGIGPFDRVDDDDEDEIRPGFLESASESQPQRQIHQSQTIQPLRPHPVRDRPSLMVEEENSMIMLEVLASDSDSDSEDEDEDEEGADGVAEAQHLNHNVPVSTPASLQQGQASSGGGLWSSRLVAAAVNNVSRAIPAVLTDSDVLDCPICLYPLCSPVFQCGNGHIICSSCFSKLKPKCPSCSLPIGINRCRAMEKLLESIRVECENAKFGCKETLVYHKKAEHEQTCPYAPCFCPVSSCGFVDSSKNLYAHFGSHHTYSATCFSYDTDFYRAIERSDNHLFFQERNEGVIFILNHDIQGHRRVFNLDCIGPSAFKGAFGYKLRVSFEKTCLWLETVSEVCSKWQQHTPNKNYLMIPDDFSDSDGRLYILIHIKKAQKVV